MPSRIDEVRFDGQNSFAQVEPDGSAGNEKTLEGTYGKHWPMRSLMVTLPPNGQQAHAERENDERNKLQQPALVDPLSL
jgi:hypothetical protein